MLDHLDHKLLAILVADSRTSLRVLAAAVGLSSPSTSERLQRLKERGIIRAFTADISPEALGFHLQAIVRVRPMPGKLLEVQRCIEAMPEVIECDKVTGDDCYVLRIVLRSMDHLDPALQALSECAQTSSAIVKSQLIKRRAPKMMLP
jgi:Lrp/AsnC family transcriptional regulator, leucine-responsive regulatory protein